VIQASATQSPAAHIGHFQTSDLDEARSRVTQVFCDHKLSVVGSRQRVKASMHYRGIGALGLGRMGYGATVAIDPGQLQSFYLVQILLKGSEGVRTAGETVHSTLEVASVVSPSEPMTMLHHEGCEKLFVRVERAALEQQCISHLGRPLRDPLVFAPGMALDQPRAAAWVRWVRWLFEELGDDLSKDSPWVDSPLLASQIEQAGIAALLQCQPHSYREVLAASGQHGISPGFVRRAEAYIDERAHEPMSVAELACHVGVSTRALFLGFRKYRGTTPMRYLAEVRMARVHDELSQGRLPGETVREVALRWGFAHLGHFSARYRQKYGELPSQTLNR
jgi:AraC-like DNA-binding protein